MRPENPSQASARPVRLPLPLNLAAPRCVRSHGPDDVKKQKTNFIDKVVPFFYPKIARYGGLCGLCLRVRSIACVCTFMFMSSCVVVFARDIDSVCVYIHVYVLIFTFQYCSTPCTPGGCVCGCCDVCGAPDVRTCPTVPGS